MRVVLSNALQPSFGVVTIPFPIPKDNYDDCMTLLQGLEVGDVLHRDCKVEEISEEWPALKCLDGTVVNVDELDYLAKRLDGFEKDELSRFGALSVTQKISDVGDLINLTFCCQSIPIVTDFTDLERIGQFCHMDRNGGVLLSESENLDFKAEALHLLQNENGKVTPYGVLYDEGFELEQLYSGKHFPQYHYQDCVMEVEVSDANRSYKEQTSLFLDLPMSEMQLRRMLVRSELDDQELIIDILETTLPHEAIPVIDFEGEIIVDVNAFCEAVCGMSQDICLKMDAVIQFTKPNNAKELSNLAQQLDLFDFVPNIHTAEEYGKHMICDSGHFEYDENLAGFYNFEKYGEERIRQEYGEFHDRGYISYHGVVSIEELLAGVDCERQEFGMQCM